MWFDSVADLVRIVLVGACGYASLVAILRLSGKRTLAKLNAFDFIVTVALGSLLATILLSTDVSLADGVVALALLVGLQAVAALMSTRLPLVPKLLKSAPRLLVCDGRMLDEAMRSERVHPEEIRQAIRSTGQGGLEDVAAVVLETDGTLSVIPASAVGSGGALEGLEGWDSHR